MWVLIGISLVLALLVVIPKAVHATGKRSVCPQCRYDLAGLHFAGTCPECGARYSKDAIVQVGWELRWRVLYRILLLMLVPALGPALFLLTYATLLERSYRWGWSNCWFQAVERDISYAAVMSLPLLANSWLLMLHPLANKSGTQTFEDVIERSDFWRRFAVLIPLGTILMASLSLIAWLYRRYAYDEALMVPAFALVVVLLGLTHLMLELIHRKSKGSRPISSLYPARP